MVYQIVNILYVLKNWGTVKSKQIQVKDYRQKKKQYEGVRQFNPGLYVVTPTSLHTHSTGESSCLLQNLFFMSYCEHQELVVLTLGQATHTLQTKSNGSYTSIQCIPDLILFLLVSPLYLQEFLKSSSYDSFSGLYFENTFLVMMYSQLYAIMYFLMQKNFSRGSSRNSMW